MTKYAEVDTDTNRVLAWIDTDLVPLSAYPLTVHEKIVEVTDTAFWAARIGQSYQYVAGVFSVIAPTFPTPTSVTRMQAKIAMMRTPGSEPNKTLLDDVQAVVTTMRATNPEIGIAWDDAQTFDRNGTFVNEIATQPPLSLTSDQIDTLFLEASKITA